MNTDSVPVHRHTVSGKSTSSVGNHSHTLSAVDAAIAALEQKVAALDTRVSALEETPPDPPDPPDPPTGKVVNVDSVLNLLDALDDNTVDEIVVANGTYPVTVAASKKADSLWIGSQFAARTRPILVRAATTGGVIFDGHQQQYWGGITFAEGAHDQTWRGFRWINGEPTGTGVIVVGAYQNLAPIRNVAMEDCEISGFWGSDTEQHGHAVYISHAYGGPHVGVMFDHLKVVDDGVHVGGGIHIYHDSYEGGSALPNYFNAHQVTVRNSTFTGVRVGFYIWAHTAKDILIEDCQVINAREYGIRYERGENVTFRRVTTTGSRYGGIAPTYYMPGQQYQYPSIPELGPDGVPGPKLITFEDCSFDGLA